MRVGVAPLYPGHESHKRYEVTDEEIDDHSPRVLTGWAESGL